MQTVPAATHPVVRAAVTALDAFGALDRATATSLLACWARRFQLTGADVEAVLACYPLADPTGFDYTREPDNGTKLAERYDMAIASGKGQPVEAVRELFARAGAGNYKLFVLHDADHAGYVIRRSIAEETARMPNHRVEVIDLLARWPANGTGLVMTNRCGRLVQRSSFGSCWREAVAAAGLPQGTRFHDLRHFYASTLIADGLYPKFIQARMRHATLAETMDTYGHLFSGHEEQGRGALDRAFAIGVPGECPETGS